MPILFLFLLYDLLLANIFHSVLYYRALDKIVSL